MEIGTREFLVKAMLDAQESVRDYQKFAGQTNDEEAAENFRQFAEQDGYKANRIKDLLQKYDNQ